jgi:hypothetical protein
MKIFGKKVIPITYLNLYFFQIDIRWFFVWLEKLEQISYRKQKSVRLNIKSSNHKEGPKWQK